MMSRLRGLLRDVHALADAALAAVGYVPRASYQHALDSAAFYYAKWRELNDARARRGRR